MLSQVLAYCGSAGLGFVFGWTLYFANRGKSGKISASDLGAMLTAVAGGTVIGGFGTGDKSAIVGAYGIGLFAGFMCYFLLLAYFTRRSKTTQIPTPLLSVETDPSVGPPLSRNSLVNLLASNGSETDMQRIVRETNQALLAIDVLILDVGAKLETAEGQIFNDLTDLDYELQGTKMSLWATLGIAAFSSPEIAALSQALDGVTERLKSEAARIKTLTQQITKVDEMIAKIDKLRASVTKLV